MMLKEELIGVFQVNLKFTSIIWCSFWHTDLYLLNDIKNIKKMKTKMLIHQNSIHTHFKDIPMF